MDVAVRHYLPGRVRLHVPELCRKAALAESALAWLRAQPGVTGARFNSACASLVVEFDRAREPLLQGILSRLKAVSAREFAVLVAGAKPGAPANPPALPPAPPPKSAAKSTMAGPAKGDVPGLFSSRSPLGLPTLSLAMAFSANPFFSHMLPADKAGIIQELQRRGNVVAMVGDGINDSPALSFADIGIAMKYGADVTHESAHVVLMEDSLWKLVKAVDISRGAVSLIKQNYVIVAGLNTLALALALPGGLVSPVMTAMISNGSAIMAAINGM